MDAPGDDAELQRRSTLRQVVAGRIGNDLTAILFDGIRHPGHFQALESLVRSTAWAGPHRDPPRNRWQDLSALDKLDQAHRHQAIHDARLANKKG